MTELAIKASLDGTFIKWHNGDFHPMKVPLDFVGQYKADGGGSKPEDHKRQSALGKKGQAVRMATLRNRRAT